MQTRKLGSFFSERVFLFQYQKLMQIVSQIRIFVSLFSPGLKFLRNMIGRYLAVTLLHDDCICLFL
jgi:hypothetical protein